MIAARTALLLVLVSLLPACRGTKDDRKAPPGPPPSPTLVVETWRPPADGRLAVRQVDLYLKALDRLRAARGQQKPSPDAAPSLGESLESTPDVAVGRAAFGTAEEYLWTKERILEAEGAQLAARLSADELALLTRTVADLKARREKAPDEGSKKLLTEQISNFEAEAQRTSGESKEREPESVRANVRLLEPYRGRVAALEEEVRRVGPAAAALASEDAGGRAEAALSTADSIRLLLEEGIDRGFFAGAAALVAQDGHFLAEVYSGGAVVEPEGRKSDAAASTLWDLASLTKPIAGAALVLALDEAKLLSLDDPISRFHDLYKKTKFEGVTPRRLLAHAGGQAAWFPCYVRGEGRAAYRRTLAELDPAAPPGSAAIYSDVGYLLLADTVERALGAELDVFFRERVSSPLGLSADLLFTPEGEAKARAAGGERDDATERWMVGERRLKYVGFRSGVVNGEVNDGNAHRRGAGVSLNAGLFGTARAVAAVGEAWLGRDARLLGEATIEDALKSHTPGLEEERGLGWQLAATKDAPGDVLSKRAFGHTGFTGASLFVDPEPGRVFVLLTNRLHPDARAVDMNAFRRRFHEAGLAIS